jgi:hypothetical protein
MFLHCFAERAEDHADLPQLLFVSRRNGNRIEHRVNGHTRKLLLLGQRNAEFLERTQQFRINFVELAFFAFCFGAL